MNILTYALPALGLVVALLVMGFTIARLYRRTTPTVALVRTGAGGRTVIKDGGALVVPVLHSLTKVNLETVVISVRRMDEDALITGDKMRADMAMDFFLRVGDDKDSIARAAQTLGEKTFDAPSLTALIEPKVVDAARAVASGMTMEDLHTKRSDFVQRVQDQLVRDLEPNGLALEAVSLTSLDQTDYTNLNPNNVFNAEAMTRVTQVVTEQEERRAKREAEAAIRIAEEQNTAKRRELELAREVEESRAQASAAENAARYSEQAANARAKEQADRDAEIARQERMIAIAEKSRAESEARAEADIARARQVEAEEAVVTAREVALAERAKRVSVTKAEEEAESRATEIKVKARAEREAAEDRANAIRVEAEADADAERIRAAARKEAGLADADARLAMIEAENKLSPEQIRFNLDRIRTEALPGVVGQLMKPAEKIDSVRMFLGADGLLKGNGIGGAAAGTPANLQDAILGLSMMNPAAKKVGEMLGLQLSDGMAGVMEFGAPAAAAEEPASEVVTPVAQMAARDPELPKVFVAEGPLEPDNGFIETTARRRKTRND